MTRPEQDPADDSTQPDAAGGVLARLLDAATDDFGDPAGAGGRPLHWPALTAEDADTEWSALYEWVVQLQHRFKEMVRLPACWYRHNGLVEALAALRDHERASYADTAPPTAAVAWYTAFREIEARLRDWIADLRCGGDLNYHDPAVHAATRPDLNPPADFAAWVGQDCRLRKDGADDGDREGQVDGTVPRQSP